ncbi:MAG: hypothetical protein U0176_03320 [Bacteroidia bacterium]
MESFAKLCIRKYLLLGWGFLLLLSPILASAQSVEKDSTHWVGEWRDEGNLQYAFHLHLQPLGGNRMSGYFDWKLIWTWLPEHKSKVGASAREYVVGIYDPVKRQVKVSGIRQTDPADIISMDIYIIDVSADGKSIEGINVKPENYHGSMFGIIQPPKKPIAAKKPAATGSDASKFSSKESTKPSPGATKPSPGAAKPSPGQPSNPTAAQPKPSTPETQPAPASKPNSDAELKSREIVTKQEMRSSDDKVRIRVFDEAMIDGDVISLNWNGTWILRYYRIAKLPKEFTLDLQPGENTLVMHAENLGRYPPNTASISVQRGTKTEVLVLNSDMGKSEAIRIIRD